MKDKMQDLANTVSISRTHITIVVHPRGGYEFGILTLLNHCKNNSTVASNLYIQKRLKELKPDQAGLHIATIPVEVLKESPVLNQLFRDSA